MTENPYVGDNELSYYAWYEGYAAALADVNLLVDADKREVVAGRSIRMCPHGYVDKSRCHFCYNEFQGPITSD